MDAPAFPHIDSDDAGFRPGLTKRECFAMHALPSEGCFRIASNFRDFDLDRHFGPSSTNIPKAQLLAAAALDIADALIAQLAKSGA